MTAKQAQSRTNAGAGLSRVEIAQRAADNAQAHLDACLARLAKAKADEEKNAGKNEARKEKTQKRMLALLQLDEETRQQARRILAELDASTTIAG